MSPLPTTYTAAQVAKAYQVTESEIYRLVKAGVCNPMRLSKGKRSPMRFTEKDFADIEAALRPQKREVPQPTRRRRRGAA